MNAYLEIFDRDGEDLSSALGNSSSWRRDQSQTREKMPWITLERSAAMALVKRRSRNTLKEPRSIAAEEEKGVSTYLPGKTRSTRSLHDDN